MAIALMERTIFRFLPIVSGLWLQDKGKRKRLERPQCSKPTVETSTSAMGLHRMFPRRNRLPFFDLIIDLDQKELANL